MSTEYEIRCLEHYDGNAPADELARWPEGGAYHHHLAALHALVEHRADVLELAEIRDIAITLEGVYGAALPEFFAGHRACPLLVFDEYGRVAPP